VITIRRTTRVLLTVLWTGIVTSICATILPGAVTAPPIRYQLDASASTVGFVFTLGGARQNGTMQIAAADIFVDPANLATSRVDISLDVDSVRTPLPFARQALIGPDVLDARRYPRIRFTSTRVQLAPDGHLSGGANILGSLTVHGVTRPVTFEASLFRAKGSAPGDLSVLTVSLAGHVSRKAFGASGYGDLVADQVELNIIAVIRIAR